MERATENAWREHHRTVLRFLQRRVTTSAVAEDLAQEAFLRFHRSAPQTDDAEVQRAWLLRTARNLLVDHYRQAPTVPLPPEETLAPHESDTVSTLRELEQCVAPLATRLPEKYRSALVLDLDGIPQQEIADRHGITLAGAKSRVQRARQLLRREFERCCHLHIDSEQGLIDYSPRNTARGPC